MIRLSFEELHELQRSVQDSGQVFATILPENAYADFKDDSLFVAWARNMSREEFYLLIWRSQADWEKAILHDKDKTLVKVFADEERRRDLEGIPNSIRQKIEDEGLITFDYQGTVLPEVKRYG